MGELDQPSCRLLLIPAVRKLAPHYHKSPDLITDDGPRSAYSDRPVSRSIRMLKKPASCHCDPAAKRGKQSRFQQKQPLRDCFVPRIESGVLAMTVESGFFSPPL